jgi:hypothetical protein
VVDRFRVTDGDDEYIFYKDGEHDFTLGHGDMVVRASDYDALAAELAISRRMHDETSVKWQTRVDQCDALEADLTASRIENAHHSRVSAALQMRAELAETRIAALEAALKDSRYLLGLTVTLDDPDGVDIDTFFDNVTTRIDEFLPDNDSLCCSALETKPLKCAQCVYDVRNPGVCEICGAQSSAKETPDARFYCPHGVEWCNECDECAPVPTMETP